MKAMVALELKKEVKRYMTLKDFTNPVCLGCLLALRSYMNTDDYLKYLVSLDEQLDSADKAKADAFLSTITKSYNTTS